jgi:hypothetical protein
LISEISLNSNNDQQVSLDFKGSRYLLRVNSLAVDEETGRFMHLDLLYAALSKHTEGIYIKGEQKKIPG